MSSCPTHSQRIISVTWRLLLVAAITMAPAAVKAQSKVSLQVKTFDQDLKALPNIQIAFNDLEYFTIGDKGNTIIEVDPSEIPVREVRVKDTRFEAVSWNLSKGIIEIVIRPATTKIIHGTIQFADGNPAPNLSLIFKGKTPINRTSDQNGEFELPVPVEETLISSEKFSVTNMVITDLKSNGDRLVIQVERPKPRETPRDVPAATKAPTVSFNVARLDSISSLAAFYAVFRELPMNSLDENVRALIDDKFRQLVQQRQDSLRSTMPVYLRSISDSSTVLDDFRNMLQQAKEESNALAANRTDFESKIAVITTKLQRGVVNLSKDERNALLADINVLEEVLTANESQFYKNHNDYREIINALREKYLDIEQLQTRLSEAERLREEQNRQFRQRLIGIGGVVIVFGALIILLVTFSARLRRQTKSLQAANERIENINENLEEMVAKRTRLLEDANKELDTFLYRASHDLRSPVRSLLGLCQIIEHIGREEMVEHVQLATTGMNRVLNKLIDISEIPQETANKKQVDVLDAITKIRNKHLVMMTNADSSRDNKPIIVRRLPIQFFVDCTPGLSICTSPFLLDIILTNLVENAVSFSSMRDDARVSRVEIKAVRNNGSLRLTVNDNGVGIASALQPKIFNMFFTGRDDTKGSGLGLYAVKKCVTALHGTISFESEEGKFTTFTVEIPDAKQEPPPNR